MRFRYGLQARFLTLVAIALLVAVVSIGMLLQRQWVLRGEVMASSRDSIRHLVVNRLREQARVVGTNTASALVNPVYNFDLELIGRVVDEVLVQPDVSYVIVYDDQGAVIHDGSDSIASYGQVMSDPLAARISASDSLLMQHTDETIDVSAPIRIGAERLGGVRIGYSLATANRDEEQASHELGQRLSEVSQRYFNAVIGLLVLAIALGIVISIIMQQMLIRPIRRIAGAAREIEAGNLNVNLPDTDKRHEIGDLALAFVHMTDGIAKRDREIRRAAETDSLTGLSNRRAFRAALESCTATEKAEAFALVLADVDDFKQINDLRGHEFGDQVLCRFADRLRAVVNADEDVDARPARLGGDEFVMMVRVAEGSSRDLRDLLDTLAQALVAEFREPSQVDGHEVVISASFGIAFHPCDGRSPSELLKAADIALYAAKNAGKHRYRIYAPEMASSGPGISAN